ncbi:MAG: 6-bladed beta-propeller, partial [Alphaproteobacteria bacterium]|nr:6-bladed beta-propeller [Alphaproteobacteria bacterium]
IAATNDNHLLITSCSSHSVMVYTLEGELIHQFGAQGSDPGRFDYPCGVCVDDNELVYVADYGNKRVQVF